MKRFAASILAVGLMVGGLLIAPQAAFAATSVSGTVTRAADATPIEYADIYFVQDGESVRHTYTDSNGQFATTGLPAGDYQVVFQWSGFATEYRAATLVDGVPLVLDAALEVETVITGTIRDENGNPIDFAFVSVSREDSGWIFTLGDVTGPDGTYSIGGLGAGNVKVFAGVDGNYVGTWYVDGFSEATATTITIPPAALSVVVDITVPAGAIIEGTVVDSIGSPIDFVDVIATGAGLDYPESSGTNNDGLYRLQGLHPQLYSLSTDSDYFGLFAPSAAQSATAVLGSPATANFVVTPALVDVSEFENQVTLVSGPTTVEAGKTYTWTIEHSGNRNVYAILYSSPVYLGAAERNSYEPATLTLTIPKETTAGAHKLTFSGMDDNGEGTELVRDYLDLTVTTAALPATGIEVAPIGALAALLGGLGLLVLLGTRRTARR